MWSVFGAKAEMVPLQQGLVLQLRETWLGRLHNMAAEMLLNTSCTPGAAP